MRPRLPLCLFLLLALHLPAVAEDDPALEPLADFEKVAGAVLVLAPDLQFVPRYTQLAPVVAETHDLDRMLQARLGGVAAKLDATQTKALKNLLFKRLTATYAMALDGETGQTLERLAVKAGEGGYQRAELALRGSGEARTLILILGMSGDATRIVEAQWRGAETPATERTANASAFQAGGYDALVEAFSERVPLPEKKAAVKAKTPREVVEELQSTLIEVMKQASQLGYQGRHDKLKPVVEATHDLPRIAHLTLRRNWKGLTAAQRERFTERFAAFSVARYANRFDGYANERFEFVGEEDAGSTQVVRSNLVKSNGEKIPFVFQLRESDPGQPRILNITADGVSDLATKQAEYARILNASGFDALMSAVEAQIRKQASGS